VRSHICHTLVRQRVLLTDSSRVNEDSILAVQVFDQKKFKKKDQGFLGVINIRIGDAIELSSDSDGTEPFVTFQRQSLTIKLTFRLFRQHAHARS
jgi:hypothetical protein